MALIDFDYPLVKCRLANGRALYVRATDIKEVLEMPDGTWRLLSGGGAYTLSCDPFNFRKLGERKQTSE